MEKVNAPTSQEAYGVVDYVDYSKVIVGEDATYANDLRYAHITPDGAIDWRKEHTFRERPDLPKLLEKITVNGKPVQIPMSFADLNPDFAEFGKVGLHNVKKENFPLVIENTQNHAQVIFNTEPFLLEFDEVYLAGIVKDNLEQVNIMFRAGQKGHEHGIVGLRTDIDLFPTTYDIRVQGIGVGNTLNEMYEVFGKPTFVMIFESGNKYIHYQFGGEKYSLSFHSSVKLTDPSSRMDVEVCPNIITEISFTREEMIEYK